MHLLVEDDRGIRYRVEWTERTADQIASDEPVKGSVQWRMSAKKYWEEGVRPPGETTA